MKRRDNLLLALAVIALMTMAAISYSASTDSLLHNRDAEAALEKDKQLSMPISPNLGKLKSPGIAFLSSAIAPGAGELYSGAWRGLAFTAAEIAFWTTSIALHGQGEGLEDDYYEYVDEHVLFEEVEPGSSTATSTENWTQEDYEHATQSDNWRYVYTAEGKWPNQEPLDRVGKFYWDDLPEGRVDEPGASNMVSQTRAEARSKRDSTNYKFKQAKFFLGLVAVNHIISAIDARIAAKLHNNRVSEANAKISFHPTISPSNHVGARLALRSQF